MVQCMLKEKDLAEQRRPPGDSVPEQYHSNVLEVVSMLLCAYQPSQRFSFNSNDQPLHPCVSSFA
jgi:hypothetical protein